MDRDTIAAGSRSSASPVPSPNENWYTMRSHFSLVACAVITASVSVFADDQPQLKTFDGQHEISQINVRVVYFLPKDRKALADWKDRVDYYARRIEKFHEREFNGQSKLTTFVSEHPFVSKQNTDQLREGDANKIFFRTLREVDAALNGDLRKKNGFPIILVLSEINWRPLDDFYRLRPDGQFEGNIGRNGRHFPGAKSGGARAVYLSRQGIGWGLVSADGWRVPYSGSDCVVYHEGVGHPIGLPHPDPIDASVMGTGQYHFWISQTTVNREQKLKLGWKPPVNASKSDDLFSTFTAIPDPSVPKPGQLVALKLNGPRDTEFASFELAIQTSLNKPWTAVETTIPNSPKRIVSVGKFPSPMPVSYRVKATTKDGESVELWGYFQVRERPNLPPHP